MTMAMVITQRLRTVCYIYLHSSQCECACVYVWEGVCMPRVLAKLIAICF